LRLGLGGLFGICLAVGIWRAALGPCRAARWPLVVAALLPPVAIALLDPWRASWHVRFILAGMPFALIVAAHGVTSTARRAPAAGAALGLCLLVGNAIGIRNAASVPFDDWRAVARTVRADALPGDVALVGVASLGSYYLGDVVPVRQRPVAIGRSAEATADDLARAVADARRVWLIPRVEPLTDPVDLVPTLLARASKGRDDIGVGGLQMTRLVLGPGARIAMPPPSHETAVRFGDTIALDGWSAERAEAVHLSLEMRVIRTPGEDLKVFAHLLDAEGRMISQRDVLIYDELRRTTAAMEAGTRLRIEIAIEAPAETLARGRSISMGVYQLAPPGARLALVPPAPEHRLLLPIDP
jgi:hypothetical protein